jgi:hypothetical protein
MDKRERDAYGRGRIHGFAIDMAITLLLIFLFQYLDAHR